MKKNNNKVRHKGFFENGQARVIYLDLSADEDFSLRLIANLLSLLGGEETLSSKDSHSLSALLIHYLNRKIVREHVFFDRPLFECTFTEESIRRECHRVRVATKLCG